MKKVFTNYEDHLKESLKDPEFKKIWDESRPEYLLADSLIKARLEKKFSQRELAKEIKTSQAAISRVEGMSGNPSLSFLKRIAAALNSRITLKLDPL